MNVTLRLVPNSLAFRLLFVLGVWTVTALVATGIVISTYFKTNAERSFESLLEAHSYNLIGAIENEDGVLRATPDFGEPRFSAPLSGWYWTVSDSRAPSKPLLNSVFVENENLDIPTSAAIPFDQTFKRHYTHSENDIRSFRVETQLYLGEESSVLYQVMVAGNRDELDDEINRISNNVWLFLTLFGIGTITIGYFAVMFGLKPLARAQRQLGEIREGREEKLGADYPEEIQPLALEINALVEANKTVVDRARTQVGNLAHGLKTPLAVIKNEHQSPNNKSWDLVAEQAGIMDSQIKNYLDRARISAQRGSTTARTEFNPAMSRIIRVMRKLKSEINFSSAPLETEVIFRMEEQDFEEILGNLIENASKFAKSKVLVSMEFPKPISAKVTEAKIVIEDDGPGLSEVECQRALLRGERIDESISGSGLGLSIVKDIVAEYKGTFTLERSKALGGMRACVSLPIVAINL